MGTYGEGQEYMEQITKILEKKPMMRKLKPCCPTSHKNRVF